MARTAAFVDTALTKQSTSRDTEGVSPPPLAGLGQQLVSLARVRVSPSPKRRILIYGVGDDAVSVKDAIDRSSIRNLSVVGFYTPHEDANIHASIPCESILNPSMSLAQIAAQYQVSEIVIAVRERRGGALPLTELLNLKLQGIKVFDLSAFFEQHRGKVQIDNLRESWFIFGHGFRQGMVRMAVKRCFDVLASGLLLLMSLPIMLCAAVAIKLTSNGPVIYRQERVGLGGRTFDVLKFRSMRTDAEKDGTPQWAQKGDSRVTPVGRFMRLTRIDELPQIFNVFRGEMSLVGPRPERPYFVDQITATVPFYAARHSVKPGVTGWAQVRHNYGASITDAADKLEYDLYYVKNHRLWLDIMILFHSVRVVLLAQGSR